MIDKSKVVAHLLPILGAPVDREHTSNFLFGNAMFKNGPEQEWRLERKIDEEFYHPIVDDKDFQRIDSLGDQLQMFSLGRVSFEDGR